MEDEDSREGLSTIKVTLSFHLKQFILFSTTNVVKKSSLKKCVQLYFVFVSMKFVSIVKSMP
jgi:hypothetical protein